MPLADRPSRFTLEERTVPPVAEVLPLERTEELLLVETPVELLREELLLEERTAEPLSWLRELVTLEELRLLLPEEERLLCWAAEVLLERELLLLEERLLCCTEEELPEERLLLLLVERFC